MSMETKFEFDKLNRIPKKAIQLAIKEYKEKNPNKALNRYEICTIISQELESRYLISQEAANANIDDSEPENSKTKKNYNGQHILKKMKLDTTGKILEKIDFYIYRYY